MAIYYPACRVRLTAILDNGQDVPTADRSNSFTIGQHGSLVPSDCSVSLNAASRADTCRVSLPLRALPFDPRVLRSVLIEVFCYAAPSLVHDAGRFLTEEHLEIVALANEAQIHLDRSAQRVELDADDLTGVLLRKTWNDPDGLDPEEPLGEAIQRIVDQGFGGRRTLTVRVVDATGEDPSPIGARGALAAARRRKTTITGRGRTPAKRRRLTVPLGKPLWNVATDLAGSLGYTVVVRGWDVILSRASVDQALAARGLVRVAYGKNLGSLEVRRRYANDAPPQVAVRGYDPSTRRVIVGKWPAQAPQKLNAAGGQDRSVYEVTLHNLTDPALAQELAREYYHQRAVGESAITWSTRHLRDTDDRDLVSLRPKQAALVAVDLYQRDQLLDLDDVDRTAALTRAGYPPRVAAIISANLDQLDTWSRPLYVRAVDKTWSADSGLTLRAECVGFVTVSRS